MNKKEIAEKILQALGKQSFADWYTKGNFDDYISSTYPKGDPRQPTRERILRDMERLFDL